MPQLTLATAHLPDVLAHEVDKFCERLLAQGEGEFAGHLAQLVAAFNDANFATQLTTVVAASPFAAELCVRHPDWLLAIYQNSGFTTTNAENAILDQLRDQLRDVSDAKELDRILRINRNREMLRIIWRDFNRLADMVETTRDISLLAEVSVSEALAFHNRVLTEELGTPTALIDGEAEAQQLVVLGMGKLGARELNLSSDIDLIFCFPHGGETVGARRSMANQEYFIRLGQRLIQSLNNITADGFVFRVDMRLRPYGESGPLAMSFAAMEEYYQDQGRDWERYAMVKARPLTGADDTREQIMELLRPFTYRRYIDFSAIESLRSMKDMIQKEVKRRRLQQDVKLGPGGIREIEFIAQCFQLIRGGRETQLQERNLLKVLSLLVDHHCLSQEGCSQLQQAYIFLRNAEHAIQGFKDQQTQALPQHTYPRAAMAVAMGFADWPSFIDALENHREHVSAHFADIVAAPEAEHDDLPLDEYWQQAWQHPDTISADTLADRGHEEAGVVLERLRLLHDSPTVNRMQPIARERLDALMPLLLRDVLDAEKPSQTLLRILPLVESVLRRTAYLVLLVENPQALKQLVELCAASPWISAQVARHPALLDELLDTRSLYTTPEKALLREDLLQGVLRLPWDDLEAHMEALRYFKLSHVLGVAALEVTGRMPLMKVSDYLTYIAEVILEHVLELAWQDLTTKHGRPINMNGDPCDKDFIVVAYGKLGGIELGHGSDIDLVFIHNGGPNTTTDGERPLDSNVFFTRLGQRMIHILTAQTPMGALYEVDMRLRPSGASGLLVSSLKAYTDYQQNQAWTWEHQALVRARVVAGDDYLAQEFTAVREAILARPREVDALRQEVVDMRHKMREHLAPRAKGVEKTEVFHLKQSPGAIVDIEFMVQYAVLAWSAEHPSLTVYSDNIRILEALGNAGLFSAMDVDVLIEAFKAYRVSSHSLSLQQLPAEVPVSVFVDHRDAVVRIWQQLMGEAKNA